VVCRIGRDLQGGCGLQNRTRFAGQTWFAGQDVVCRIERDLQGRTWFAE
jgi:hypothetical protein